MFKINGEFPVRVKKRIVDGSRREETRRVWRAVSATSVCSKKQRDHTYLMLSHVKMKKQRAISCELSSIEARRLILMAGLSRDIGRDDMPTVTRPNKLCHTVTSLLDCSCMRGWTITKFIAAGASGHVFRAVHRNGSKAAVKIQIGDASRLRKEVRAQKAFEVKGLAPKVVRYCSFKPNPRLSWKEHMRLNDSLPGKSVPFATEVEDDPESNLVHIIIMEEIDGVLGTWLKRERSEKQLEEKARQIIGLMKAFRKHRFTHGDFHLNNIGFVYTNASKTKMKLMPIDFGRAYVGRAYTNIEMGSLMRTIDSTFRSIVPMQNRKILVTLIRKVSLEEINYVLGNLKLVIADFRKDLGKYMRAHIL